MFDLDIITLGYYISAAFFSLGSAIMAFGYWFRKKAKQTPVVALSQQIPKAKGLCETTVWVANPTTKNLYIRNFILKSGTFATDEIRNEIGQIIGYRKGYSSFYSAGFTVQSGAESSTPIAFHVEEGIPVIPELVGKKGVYDIHFTQPKPKASLLPFFDLPLSAAPAQQNPQELPVTAIEPPHSDHAQ